MATLRDLGSSNGTFVNGERLRAQEPRPPPQHTARRVPPHLPRNSPRLDIGPRDLGHLCADCRRLVHSNARRPVGHTHTQSMAHGFSGWRPG